MSRKRPQDRRPGSGSDSSRPGIGGLSITISLAEIYDALCPSCREAFLSLLEDKARAGTLREGLRRQLEAPAHPERSEGPPGVDR